MKRIMKSIGTGLQWCGTLCLVAIALPLIAVAEFIVRGLLLALAGTGILIGLFFYWLNPRFRMWVDHRVNPRGTLFTHSRVRH